MKKFLCSILIFSTVLLVGCDTNENDNLEICTEWYLNTTETISISTFNGFKLIKSKRIDNEDGSIGVILYFDKPLR